jgi:hypothetical protein
VVCEENERKAKELAKKYGLELKDDADFIIYGCTVSPGVIAPEFGGGTFKLSGEKWAIDIHMGKSNGP